MGSLLLLVFLGSLFSLLFFRAGLTPLSNASYTEGLVGEIVHINPVFTEFSEADADVSRLVFSGLVKYNAQTGLFEEDMATHILSEDQLVYTFTLKNDLLWQDGEPVTADDIVFTFANVIQSESFNNPILKSNFEGAKIEHVNSRTVRFTLNSPNAFFFTAFTVGLLPAHILKDVPVADLDTHEFNQMPIGTGPYTVTSPYEINDDGSTVVSLSVSPHYYGEKTTIKNIRFIAYPTLQDLVDHRSTWNGAARIRQSLLDEMETSELHVFQYELPQYTALFFNTDAPLLQKNKERLGISKAIDKEEILDALGFKVRIDTPLLELNQGEWIYDSNISEAQGALFDAGWTLEDGQEIRSNEDGETLSLRLVRRDFSEENELQEETYQITADLIQRQLREVGVEVKIESYPLEELQSIRQKRDYDLLLYGQSLGYNLDTFAYWHSSQATETGLNLSNYQNPDADFLIESLRATFDEAEKQELLKELATTIAEDIPAIFLYAPSYYYVLDSKVSGVAFKKLLLPKDRFTNINEWTIQ